MERCGWEVRDRGEGCGLPVEKDGRRQRFHDTCVLCRQRPPPGSNEEWRAEWLKFRVGDIRWRVLYHGADVRPQVDHGPG